MTTLRQAAQQALEAMGTNQYTVAELAPHKVVMKFNDAITALQAALEQPEQKTCSTCEALARTVMLDQTSHDQFKPDWNTEAVLVEEMQRMAKRIEDLEAMLERQTARIVDLQTHIENFDGEDR